MRKRVLGCAIVVLCAGMLLTAILGCSKSSAPDFLSSKFRVSGPYGPPPMENWNALAKTYPSLETCTVEKFSNIIKGDKHWEKTDNSWILKSELTDEVTKKRDTAAFVFNNTSDGIVLTRAVMDDQDYPSGQLINFVIGIMEGATQK